ncbi:hypothetical protein [Sphingomonas aquatilis]
MNITKAVEWLQKAIALHRNHMNGTAPTTGEAGEKSQMLMMEQMENALSFLKKEPAKKMAAMNNASGKQVRVNVATMVNASRIRREKRAGRDVIIVPSATLPDNVVMNKIRYPAPVIADSFKSLEGRPAPLGHPMVNGQYVSASSPDGIIRGFIGAHNENVRRENGKVLVDKVIDVAFANQSDGGKAVLAAIDKQEPIHTSTGLLATLKPIANDATANFEVESMVLDHDCFLLDEPGAATPEQGVGVFVNSAGDQLEVINSSLEDDLDRELTWAAESIVRVVERKEQEPLIERIKLAILRIVQGGPTPDNATGDALDDEEPMDKAQFDAMMAKLDAIGNAAPLTEEKVGAIFANALKPITDAMEAQAATAKAKDEADHAALVNKVVEAGLLDEATAKEAAAPVLNALLSKQPKAAFSVNRAFTPAAGKTDRAALAPKGE